MATLGNGILFFIGLLVIFYATAVLGAFIVITAKYVKNEFTLKPKEVITNSKFKGEFGKSLEGTVIKIKRYNFENLGTAATLLLPDGEKKIINTYWLKSKSFAEWKQRVIHGILGFPLKTHNQQTKPR